MLYLKPPFHLINGVAVFADHANERQFYYMPAMPHLTTVTEVVNGTRIEVPRIQLLKFRGERHHFARLKSSCNSEFHYYHP